MLGCREIIKKKRDGEKFSENDIREFIDAVSTGKVDRAQIGAWTMACYIHGLDEDETGFLTKYMMRSGKVLSHPKEYQHLVVDKHSTGGVGDKISLVLAPCLAACGLKVPMISGRSLDHTGGTLNKLESIPGLNVSFPSSKMQDFVENVGCCIVGQAEDLVPADKIIYAVRDVSGTVDNTPLIVASILSKKLAEGLSALILDVKSGCGAFMKTKKDALDLGNKMLQVAIRNNVKCSVFITDMDSPLGSMIGNTLEVLESWRCLKGIDDKHGVMDLVENFGGELLRLTGLCKTLEEGVTLIKQSIKSGKALQKFKEMIQEQGVTATVANDVEAFLPKAKRISQIKYKGKEGIIEMIDSLKLSHAILEEHKRGSSVETTGIEIIKHVGDQVKEGDVWLHFHHDSENLTPQQCDLLTSCLSISSHSGFRKTTRVLETLSST